jgi:hypothetical protein
MGRHVIDRAYWGAPENRLGRNQRAVWRALVSYGRAMTTPELAAFCYPRAAALDRSGWLQVRRAAERYAERVPAPQHDRRGRPRRQSRPLLWRLKPELFDE